MKKPLPDGYTLIPRDHHQAGVGGLRLGSDRILATERGCWEARWRNWERRPPAPRWLWLHEADASAVLRYRNRAWLASGRKLSGDEILHPTCGSPHCLRPDHQRVERRNIKPPAARGPGRWEWVGEGEDEEYRWIADPPKARAPRAPAARGTKGRPNHTANRVRGADHAKAKLDPDKVRAIRAAKGVSNVALAARYGVTKVAIRKVRLRLTWAHIE